MSSKTPLMNLEGAMGLIKKSTYPLAPLYEAMTNSLESIAQRTFNENEQGEITVKLHFTGLIDEIKELKKIEVIDNGIGFTEENYKRFIEFFDKSKGYDNRGSGRLQYLHRFEKIEVNSVYFLNTVKHKRLFVCDASRFIHDESNEQATTDDLYATKVVMSECLAEAEEKDFFDNLSIDDILKDITRYFLLRFYLDNQKDGLNAPDITIIFIKDDNEIERRSLLPSNMPTPQTTGNIDVPYMKIKDAKSDSIEWVKVKDKKETINWAHFKIPEDELYQNGVYLCSKDIPVQSLTFNQIKKKESIDGFRYLTAFYGDVLDKSENVSDSVDSFNFPKKKAVEESINDLFFDEKKEYLLTDSIKEKVNKVIPSIYKDVFDLQEEKVKDIESIAKAHGIPLDVASKASINLTDDEQTITRKIYSEQSDRLATKGFQVKKLYESLSTLNPTSDTYQEDLRSKTVDLSNLVEHKIKRN